MKKVSARGITIKDDKVLFVHRMHCGDKHYSIPGGKIKPGEYIEKETMAIDPTNYFKPMWIPLKKIKDLRITPDPAE
jgi:hypothetical protein